jgi:hypothetical protein
MVVGKLHGSSWYQSIQRAEDGGVTKSFGDTPRIKHVDLIRQEMKVGRVTHGNYLLVGMVGGRQLRQTSPAWMVEILAVGMHGLDDLMCAEDGGCTIFTLHGIRA